MLSKRTKDYLEKKGLILYNIDGSLHIIKPIGITGNSIPNFNSPTITLYNNKGEKIREVSIDCPTMKLSYKKEAYDLICWDWAPGPGPGDFNIEFNDEKKLIAFIESYYFGENHYFELRKRYEIQNRDTINIKEIKSILKKLTAKLENEFANGEIEFGERGTFHKIPYELWRIRKFEGEEPIIKVKTGFLKNEVSKLRRKLSEEKEFDYEDINNISDLLFELSLLIKEKTELK